MFKIFVQKKSLSETKKRGIKNKIQTAQNKMIRFILGHHQRKHLAVREFKSVKMLNVNSRIEYLNLSLTHNIVHNVAPEYLCQDFTRISHKYDTKYSRYSFIIPIVHSQGKKSFRYNAIIAWNNLPIGIKNCSSKESFKSQLKLFLFKKMSDEENNCYVYY